VIDENLKGALVASVKMESVSTENNEYDGLEECKIREEAKRLNDQLKILEQTYVDLGKVLYIIHRDKLWKGWGHKSFSDYAIGELDLEQSRAYYYRKIYDNICVRLAIDGKSTKELEDQVKEIGWSKASQISSKVEMGLVDGSNIDEEIEGAKTKSKQDLVNEVKVIRETTIVEKAREQEKKVPLSFHLPPDMYDLWAEIRNRYCTQYKIAPHEVNNESLFCMVLLAYSAEVDLSSDEFLVNLFTKVENLYPHYKVIVYNRLKKDLVFGHEFCTQFAEAMKE